MQRVGRDRLACWVSTISFCVVLPKTVSRHSRLPKKIRCLCTLDQESRDHILYSLVKMTPIPRSRCSSSQGWTRWDDSRRARESYFRCGPHGQRHPVLLTTSDSSDGVRTSVHPYRNSNRLPPSPFRADAAANWSMRLPGPRCSRTADGKTPLPDSG